MSIVTIQMPLELTGEMLRAVKNHPLCSMEDKDEMNTRIGWLLCAYEAMVEYRIQQLKALPATNVI